MSESKYASEKFIFIERYRPYLWEGVPFRKPNNECRAMVCIFVCQQCSGREMPEKNA